MNLEGDTLLQIQKWRDAICSAFLQYLSANNRFMAYKYLSDDDQQLSSFVLPLETFQVFHNKRKVSVILKSTLSSSGEILHYHFFWSTKITCQNQYILSQNL